MVNIIKDKELIWETDKYDVILVGTSIYCMLSGGFQSKMRFKYPFLEPANDKLAYADSRRLGTRLTLEEKGCPIISLLFMCNYPRVNKEFIDYDALEKCLKTANKEFAGKNIASTILGSSKFDGNGDKERCIKMIEACMPDVNITLYDYEQKVRTKEIDEYRTYVFKLKFTDKELHKKLTSEIKDYLRSQYLM